MDVLAWQFKHWSRTSFNFFTASIKSLLDWIWRYSANVTIVSCSIGVPVRCNQVAPACRPHDDVLHIPPGQQRTNPISQRIKVTTNRLGINVILAYNTCTNYIRYMLWFSGCSCSITLPPKSERWFQQPWGLRLRCRSAHQYIAVSGLLSPAIKKQQTWKSFAKISL